MRRLFIAFTAVLLFLITACGGKTNTLTEKDIEIINVHTNEKISHGMSRAEIEKILGKGEKIGDDMFGYDEGVTIIYKDDKLIGIMLSNRSKGIFETAQGVKIGMLGSEVLELYGSQNNIDNDPRMIEFAYEENSGKFLKEYPKSDEEAQAVQIYTYDSFLDDNQYIFSINLIDSTALVKK
ncbi:hypothetical protein IFU39_13725 [Paenibacillus sp. CFBP 13594]|uniref:hypothetical protein n=1 Tax=Paenibacillus sp. CFBP 13594 TaxID=2774037 RepID=UPI00177E877E|nr:hypothetical protein [Paenibacillus sp. CFBP 13594]MBD8838875.1 hypothetical protein [Paenibacillus sp. CFBP 13594]